MGKCPETRETVPAEPASSGMAPAAWQQVRMLCESRGSANAEDVRSALPNRSGKSHELIFKKKTKPKIKTVLFCFGKFMNIGLCLPTLSCPLLAMNVG